MKPPAGWTPQHRRGAKRTPLAIDRPQFKETPVNFTSVKLCPCGLTRCDRHRPVTYVPGVAPAKPNPAKTLVLQRPEWLR